MGCPNHGLLGNRFHAGGVRSHRDTVLLGALSAGNIGGRLFPWDHRLSDPLVPVGRPRERAGSLHGGTTNCEYHWRTGFRFAVGHTLVGHARLALAVLP